MSGDNIFGLSNGCPALGMTLFPFTRRLPQNRVHAIRMKKLKKNDHQYRQWMQTKKGAMIVLKEDASGIGNNFKTHIQECTKVPHGNIDVGNLDSTNLNSDWFKNAGIHSTCQYYDNPRCDDSYPVDE